MGVSELFAGFFGSLVRCLLRYIETSDCIDDEYCLYVSFITNYDGVVLSEEVRKKYDDSITIVFQHQFSDLKVFDDKFAVNLSFFGVEERVEVPFAAITGFSELKNGFTVQFSGFPVVNKQEIAVVDVSVPGCEERENGLAKVIEFKKK